MRTSIRMILMFCIVLFADCSKRPFAYVEVHGRIISSRTNQSLQAQIQLWTGSHSPGSKGSVLFGTTQTRGDGSFDIKSNEGWSSDDYYIEILPDSSYAYSVSSRDFHITRNQNMDAGTIAL